jgi:hypothetical protein
MIACGCSFGNRRPYLSRIAVSGASDRHEHGELPPILELKAAMARPIIWFMCHRSARAAGAMRTPLREVPGLP